MTDGPGPNAATSALQLYAGLLGSTSLVAAAHLLVDWLARDGRFDRVALSQADGARWRHLASSALDASGTRDELTTLRDGAMQESLDQGIALRWPAQDDVVAEPEAGAADAILLEHRRWQAAAGGSVATIPLGNQGLPFGVVSLERRTGAPISDMELRRVEQQMMLAAPAMRWMVQAELSWTRRARTALGRGLTQLRQPSRGGARAGVLVAVAVALFAVAVPMADSVSGRARIEGSQQVVLSAPADGFLKVAHVRPGDRVAAGAPLVDLAEEDLELEREGWNSQLAQHENAYAAAMARSDRVGASTSLARVTEARAQLALIAQQRARTRVVAPFDGLVVQGDLSQSIGTPVRQGAPLMTLANTASFRVIVQVDESDIERVRVGQRGRLTLSSQPWEGHEIAVERITPMARAVEGRNVFEVQARLDHPPAALRPGLLGRAELIGDRAPLLWSWTRRLVERVRLAWWSWLG